MKQIYRWSFLNIIVHLLIQCWTIDGQTKSNSLSSSININELYEHLTRLEDIANSNNQNRAIQTTGFNVSLDYIQQYLIDQTNLIVEKQEFFYRPFQLSGSQSFSSIIDGKTTNHVYSTTLSRSDFSVALYSMPFNNNQDYTLVSIPNFGCSDSDWLSFPIESLIGRIAVVKRGDCTFIDKARLAEKYRLSAILIFNDGTASDRFQPITINLGEENQIACLFLSYTVGQTLFNDANNPLKRVSVRMTVSVNKPSIPVSNICAHTPTGDPTKTILIGSHSDSVPAGPGINDNGQWFAIFSSIASEKNHNIIV